MPPRRLQLSYPAALVFAALSGAALAAVFPSLGWSILAWVALVPLWIVVARVAGGWRAWWCGYLAGAIFFALSCPWIASTVQNYGGLEPAIAAVVFLLFLALMGSYLALFAWAGYWIGRRLGHRFLPLPFLWVAVELLRTYTPMGGFPWNLLGYGQYQNLGFMRVATVAGVYGASLLIALVNTGLAALGLSLYERRRWGWAAAGAAILVVAIWIFAALPYHPPSPAPTLHARLVQPDTPLNATWTTASLEQFLNAQLLLSAPLGAPPVGLILWPEQPAPLDYQLQAGFQRTVAELQGFTASALLFGEVTYAANPAGAPQFDRPRNSALLINPDGTVGPRYDKIHLVPFGEYVPLPAWLADWAGVSKLVAQVGDFIPGRTLVLFSLGRRPFATMICYESIFPAVARQEVASGAQWLVNQSDDSWYGRSSAAAQGLMMARVRAIENRRWLLRDTNNGLTAVIDPYGRITAELPRGRAAALQAGFAPSTTLTFYTRHGDWLPDLCAVIIGVLALLAGLRPALPGAAPLAGPARQ